MQAQKLLTKEIRNAGMTVGKCMFSGLLLLVCLPFTPCHGVENTNGLCLAKDKRTEYAITVSTDDLVANTAAKELAKYLKAVSGADFAIVSAKDIKRDHVIAVGSDAAKAIQPDLDLNIAKLGDDGIVVKTSGTNLILSGAKGGKRGTLYAVYEFLESSIGCRWWTSTEEFVPNKGTLNILPCDISYTPPISVRQSFYMDVNRNPTFSAKLKSQGFFQSVKDRPELGGGTTLLPIPCHTYYKLLPPEKYFSTHPEWYSSDKNGRRFHEEGQLCLTNKEMTDEMIKVIDGILAESKNGKYIALNPMDCGEASRCQCANCLAVEKEEGGAASGPIIRFTNSVANAIAEKHPGSKIVFLPYWYCQAPPKETRCAENIVLEFCTSDSSMFHAADSVENKVRCENFMKWKSLNPGNEFWIWDYNAVFNDFLQPFPNYGIVAQNIKFFAKSKVSGIFLQGDNCSVGDFNRMRAWIVAHLLWNPELSYDALETEFMGRYYGNAAPYLKDYLRMMERNAAEKNVALNLGQADVSFLSADVIRRASELFAKALDAVKDDPALHARVEREMIPLLYVAIMRSCQGEMKMADCPAFGCADETAAINELELLFKVWNVKLVRESGSNKPSQLIEAMRKALNSPIGRLEFTGKDAKYQKPNLLQVNDGKSSTGYALKIPREWFCQYPLGYYPPLKFDGAYVLKVFVRCEIPDSLPPSTKIFSFGYCGTEVRQRTVTAKEISDGEYHVYDLVLGGGQEYIWKPKIPALPPYLWIAAASDDPKIPVFFDKMQVRLTEGGSK